MSDDIQLCIAGQWTKGAGGRTVPVLNPATGETIGSVAVAETADLDSALQAAATSFETWKKTSPLDRGKVLRKAAELLRERVETIAPIMTRQQGKILAEARMEVMVSAEVLEWFAEEARRAYGRIVTPRIPGVYNLVLKEPVGVAVGFVPWNFGMGQAARKIGAALAAGCTIIIKGPEETPTSCSALMQVLLDAGLPTGVVSLVFGAPSEISDYLIPHRTVRKVSFTGSTAVGKQLAALAGKHMKRFTAELGGHSPVIVTKDVDIDAVAKLLCTFKYRNAGQVCTAPTRFLIEKDIFSPFVKQFTKYASEVKVGDGMKPDSMMGPMANQRRVTALESLIDDAKKHGAKVELEGGRFGNQGFFFKPSVLSNVPTEARIMSEEPFGPVALMASFTDVDEALAEANRLDYGLASYAFTRSMKVAEKVTSGFKSGMVSVNHFGIGPVELPFGGVNDSGYGSEGGLEAIESYLSTKTASQAMA